jgi:hypothetical protein
MEQPTCLLSRRIEMNRQKARQLVPLATHPTLKLDLQRALDDLDDAARWVTREDPNCWIEVARSVSVTIDFAEWRLGQIESLMIALAQH